MEPICIDMYLLYWCVPMILYLIVQVGVDFFFTSFFLMLSVSLYIIGTGTVPIPHHYDEIMICGMASLFETVTSMISMLSHEVTTSLSSSCHVHQNILGTSP